MVLGSTAVGSRQNIAVPCRQTVYLENRVLFRTLTHKMDIRLQKGS